MAKVSYETVVGWVDLVEGEESNAVSVQTTTGHNVVFNPTEKTIELISLEPPPLAPEEHRWCRYCGRAATTDGNQWRMSCDRCWSAIAPFSFAVRHFGIMREERREVISGLASTA